MYHTKISSQSAQRTSEITRHLGSGKENRLLRVRLWHSLEEINGHLINKYVSCLLYYTPIHFWKGSSLKGETYISLSRRPLFIPCHTIVVGYFVFPSKCLFTCPSIGQSVCPSALKNCFRSQTGIFFYGFYSNFAYIHI